MQEGDRIEKGEIYSTVNPRRTTFWHQGRRGARQLSVNEIQEVYRLQGVTINDKHIEVIVRQMLQKIEVEPIPGDTDFLGRTGRPDRVRGRERCASRPRRASKPAEGQPVLLGITKASAADRSFISAASFQETTRVLTEAAVNGKVDIPRRPQGKRHRRPAHPGRDGRHDRPSTGGLPSPRRRTDCCERAERKPRPRQRLGSLSAGGRSRGRHEAAPKKRSIGATPG